MPPIVANTVWHLTLSKGTSKEFIKSLIGKLERCCNADPLNTPDNLYAITMNLKLFERHIHKVVETQEQIQDEPVSEVTLCELENEHDEELKQIRLLVMKGKRLID